MRSTAALGWDHLPSTTFNHWLLLKPIYHHRWTQERGNLSRSPPWQTQQIKLIRHHHHTTVNPQLNFNLKREIRNQKRLNPIRQLLSSVLRIWCRCHPRFQQSRGYLSSSLGCYHRVLLRHSRPIVRRGRTRVGRETNSEKRKKKSNKEVRGQRKMNKKIINSYSIVVRTVSKMQRYCSMLQKFDTFNTSNKTPLLLFGMPNAKYYSI